MVQAQIAQHLLSALGHLKKERAEVEERIAAIEQMISRQGAAAKATARTDPPKKRGRPRKDAAPAAPAKKAAPAAKKGAKKKAGWTAAARAAARERMRKYWADRRRKGG
jgi:hypothetical protein